MTCLVPDLTGIDPDDAFSTVPYEKGQAFLWYLEELVGGPSTSVFFSYSLVTNVLNRNIPSGEFDPFLKSYIANYQYKSIVTSDFIEYIKHYFKGTPAAAKLEQLDWQTWLHTPGMPPTFAT